MAHELLIAGGGMAGLAAAIAASRAGWRTRVFEQAPMFSEVGAGVQIGPNASRLLIEWGLEGELQRVAAFPRRLLVCDAHDGRRLGGMELGDLFAARYGAPYVTVHRADLHGVLEAGARRAQADIRLGSRVTAVVPVQGAVGLVLDGEREVEGDALAGADGLWSDTRGQVYADGPPTPTGHVAFRALVRQDDLPTALRQQDVHVWLGPRMHLVAYPVCAGDWLNVAAFVEGRGQGDARDWDREAVGGELRAAAGALCRPLEQLLAAVHAWRQWTLHGRAPLSGPDEMVRGRVALLGDAAHPMLPYLAQGAGMAIEDAAELGRVLAQVEGAAIDVPLALRRYALNRWQRDARVQTRALRNGRIFHADGLLRTGRDLAMRMLGEKLLDMPWLYRGG